MKMRRLLSCMMALLLAVSMPLTALADDWYLDEGDITVSASESGQTVSQGSTTQNDNAPVISQSRPESSSSGNSGSGSSANTDSAPTGNTDSAPTDNSNSTPHTITITADKNATANVTLNGVNINADGAAIQTSGEGNVVIELDGENKVQSGYQHAGVEKQNSGNLTITDKNETVGSLEANGGYLGSGIGGGNNGDGTDITITDGKVTANGGALGSGIGGGSNGDGTSITITGGTVQAYGGKGGAGIGGGDNGDGCDITISGGSVTAVGGAPKNDDGTDNVYESGAGIGGGAYGSGDNITIKNNSKIF